MPLGTQACWTTRPLAPSLCDQHDPPPSIPSEPVIVGSGWLIGVTSTFRLLSPSPVSVFSLPGPGGQLGPVSLGQPGAWLRALPRPEAGPGPLAGLWASGSTCLTASGKPRFCLPMLTPDPADPATRRAGAPGPRRLLGLPCGEGPRGLQRSARPDPAGRGGRPPLGAVLVVGEAVGAWGGRIASCARGSRTESQVPGSPSPGPSPSSPPSLAW